MQIIDPQHSQFQSLPLFRSSERANETKNAQQKGEIAAKLARAVAPHARKIRLFCDFGYKGEIGLWTAIYLQRALNQHLNSTQAINCEIICDLNLNLNINPKLNSDHSFQSILKIAQETGILFSDNQIDLSLNDFSCDDLLIDALLDDLNHQNNINNINIINNINNTNNLNDVSNLDENIYKKIDSINSSCALVLALNCPSGLCADSGALILLDQNKIAHCVRATYTLCFSILSAGLWMNHGRDFSGQIWLDHSENNFTKNLKNDLKNDLDSPNESPTTKNNPKAIARLNAKPLFENRLHAHHKGSFGDVAILGGEGLSRRGIGMSGAAFLAAQAALHAGAGRVLLALLDDVGFSHDPAQPELMLRSPENVAWHQVTTVCGCGGGAAIRPHLSNVLQKAPQLVLDADALNVIATQPFLQNQLKARHNRNQTTVLTPHPLEAARLLSSNDKAFTTTYVQSNRLSVAQDLADYFGAIVVLKGSGSVIARPCWQAKTHSNWIDDFNLVVNPTGNARLATAGTGDVLAGWIGAYLASGKDAFSAACAAVFLHGKIADDWSNRQHLTANVLARAIADTQTH